MLCFYESLSRQGHIFDAPATHGSKKIRAIPATIFLDRNLKIAPKHLPFFDLQKLVLFDPPTGRSRDNIPAMGMDYWSSENLHMP